MLRIVGVVTISGMIAACAPAPNGTQLSAEYAAALGDSVAAIARASEAAWKLVSCQDLTPALQYWDGSPPGLVHAHEDVMGVYSDSAWAEQVKSSACASGTGESVVDSVLVAVLSRDVATATMKYHAVLKDTAGNMTSRSGEILRVFWRTADGWKIRVSMSTHSDLRK